MPDAVPAARPRSPYAFALALAPGPLLAGIAGGIVFPIFPIVGQRVGLSLPFIGLILSANRAARVVSAPFAGVLADRIGGRRTLLLGLALQIAVIALYLLGMIAHHEGAAFLIGRLLHGPGSACVFVAAQALALEAGEAGHRGATAGAVRMAIVIGVPVGFVAGGVLGDIVGEVWTFAIAGMAICVALIAGYLTVPDLQAKVARKPSLLASLVGVQNPRLLALGGLNFVVSFAAGGMVLTTLALLVEDRHLVVFGRDAQASAGLLMGLMSITDALCTPFAGRLGDRLRAHAPIAAGALGLTALGLVVIGVAGTTLGVAAGLATVGLGIAGLGPSVLVLMGACVPAQLRGAAAGFLQLLGDLGGMLGPLVGTALFATSTETPYLITAGLVVCFVPVALWLVRVERAMV
ncbi:MAG TPA: MFS transporter [Kofleriaceae bacterium]|nr:MFS transporter [Kofleriaceae bacterium]